MSYEIIVPVGTSMLTNWMRRLIPEINLPSAWGPDIPSGYTDGASPPDLRAFIPKFTAALRTATGRTCAEIDSIRRWLARQPNVQVSRVTLLVSDTPPAKWVAEALEALLPAVFDGKVIVETKPIRRLQAGDMREGLVEFIRVAAKAIKESKRRGAHPVVNATSGFKAETSLLTLLGGLLGAEIIYLHEHMQDIVSIPVVPLRWGLESNEIRLLKQIGEAATRDEVRDIGIAGYPVLWSFIERLGDGTDELWGLSALGQMVLESTGEIVEDSPSARETNDIRFQCVDGEAGHMPTDAEAIAREIGERLPFVSMVRLTGWGGTGNAGLLKPRDSDAQNYIVRVRMLSKEPDQRRVWYLLHTTATNHAQWQTARRQSAEAFGRVSLIEELAEGVTHDGDAAADGDTPQELSQLCVEDMLLAELNRSEIRQRDLANQVAARTQDLREANTRIRNQKSALGLAEKRKREQDELIKRSALELLEQKAMLATLRAELAVATSVPAADRPAEAAPDM